MLSDVCRELKNWFNTDNDIHLGVFTISGSNITPSDFIKENQYFRIVGSTFNDGVYKNDDTLELTDEEFDGAIWCMNIPKDFLALIDEMEEWNDKYGKVMSSPYSSENFGDYSYSKGSNSRGAVSSSISVNDAFKSRLDKWRKI